MRKTIFYFITILCVCMLMASCTLTTKDPDDHVIPNPKEEPAVMSFDKGIIVQQNDNGSQWLITQYHEGSSSAKVDATWVTIVNETVLQDHNGGQLTSKDFQLGQQVEVWITGPIRESYPSQATAAKIVRVLDETDEPQGMISQDIALQSALNAVESEGWFAVKSIAFDVELQVWVAELTRGMGEDNEPITIQIDGTSGEVKPQPIAENAAFRIFSPAPETEVGATFKVTGEARVFEAAFSWMLEDGHDVLAEGHVMADKGAPDWGSFEFEVSYENATNPTLLLIIYVASAKDGSMEHEVIIPLKLQQK